MNTPETQSPIDTTDIPIDNIGNRKFYARREVLQRMKRSYEMDLCSGPLLSKILLFSLPLMLGSVFQQLYTIVDTIIIGRGVGMQALASIGAADWINWLVLWGTAGLYAGLCDSHGTGVRRGRIRPAASCTGYDR